MAQLYYKLIPCSGLQSVSFRKVLGSQGRRAFEYINTGPQSRRAAGSNPRKNLLSKCHLVVDRLSNVYILKVFLIITKGNRTMSIKAKSEWIGDDGLLLRVSLDIGEKIIKDLQDPDLKAELKAALVKAAEEKAERMTNFFKYT